MRAVIAGATIACVAACGPHVAAPIPSARLAPLVEPVIVPLRLIRGVPFAQVRVDDGPPAWFAIDTGSPLTVIDATLAPRVRTRAGHTDISVTGTSAGAFQAAEVQVDGLRVGALALDGLDSIVTDLGPISAHVGIPMGGILGLPAFHDYLLTLDYPGQRAVIAAGELPAPDGDQVLPYREHARHPAVDIALGGVTTLVELDSGSGYFMELAEALLARTHLRAPLVVTGVAIGMTGQTEIRSARLDARFPLARYPIVDPIVAVSADPSVEHDGIGRLGGPLLSQFAVTFDQRTHRVRFARPGQAPLTAPPVRSSGLLVVRVDDAWRVVGFVPGTPAAAAGLQVGDLVVAVNDRPTDAFDADDWSRLDAAGAPFHVAVRRGDARLSVDVGVRELVP